MADARTVLIAGPTASGKSALALAVARRLAGAIVNADSIQVYRQLRVLSARPDAADIADVPHHLFGHVDARSPYSVARWLADAQTAIAAIHAAGQMAIVTGGTGLYFKALTEGLAPAPTSTPKMRAVSRARRERLGPDSFYDELLKLDPKAASLNRADTQRVLRAWEIASAASVHGTAAPAVPPLSATVRLVLEMDRAALYDRIDGRFDAMMKAGALDEAAAFWALEPDPALPAAKALGLPQLKLALDKALPLDLAVAAAKRDTRRYAKRQLTWFRHQMAGWQRLETTAQAPAGLVNDVCGFIGEAFG